MVKSRILAIILSALLLALPWLDITGLSLLFAFVPILWLDYFFTKNKEYYVPIVYWIHVFISLLLWHILSIWWVWYASPFGMIFTSVSNSFLLSLILLLVHIARRNHNDGFANAVLLFGWLGFEYFHYDWELSWPWLNLGNGLSEHIQLIQWYEYSGILGGSFWILLLNILVWKILKSVLINKNVQAFFSSVLLTIVVFLVPVIISVSIYRNYNEIENPINVVITQPNIDPYNDKFSGMNYIDQYNRLIGLSDSLGSTDVDFFIGPETALQDVWLNKFDKNEGVGLITRFLRRSYPQSAFVVGGMLYDSLSFHGNMPSTAHYSDDSLNVYNMYNSAMLLTYDGVKAYSHKTKLVAGVEKAPFEQYLNKVSFMTIDLGGSSGSLATSEDVNVLSHNNCTVGVPICFESAFGEYISRFVQHGAEVLFIITNDGWWKNSPGYKQHFSYTKAIAIQFRRSIARSGNTGISGIINQKGEIEWRTSWWEATALKGSLNKNEKLTFYAKEGDFIGRISLFLFLMLSLSMMVKFVLNKKKEPHYPVV